MTEFAIGSERWRRFGRKGGTKFGKTREPRARLHGCNGDERDFKCQNFVRLQRNVGKNERRVILGFDAELVIPRRQRKNSKNTFPRSGATENLAGLDVSQYEDGC